MPPQEPIIPSSNLLASQNSSSESLDLMRNDYIQGTAKKWVARPVISIFEWTLFFFFTQHSLLQLCRSSHTEYTREQLVNICIDTWNSWILNDVIAFICKMLCIRCSKGIKSIFWSDQLYHSSTKCYYSIRYLVSSSIFYIRRINNCFLHDIADWRYIEK